MPPKHGAIGATLAMMLLFATDRPCAAAVSGTPVVVNPTAWTDSGLIFMPGAGITLVAGGYICINAADTVCVTPKGMRGKASGFPFPECEPYSLVGEVGVNGAVLCFGAKGTRITINSGTLRLIINSPYLPANTGAWTALVQNPPVRRGKLH